MAVKKIIIGIALVVLIGMAGSPALGGTNVLTAGNIGEIGGDLALGYPGQRKLVRDADGYWYAVWVGVNATKYNVYMNKSTNTDGSAWGTPVVLAGSGGILLANAADNYYFPTIAIDRANGRIHLLWQRNNDSIYYSRCQILANWNVVDSWCDVDGGTSPRYDIPASYTDCFDVATPTYAPTISLDGSGGVHISFSKLDSGYYKPFYRYSSTSANWATVVQISTEAANQAFPTVEVDSNNRVHYLVRNGTTRIHAYASDNFTSFTGPSVVHESASNALTYISMAADDDGSVIMATLEGSDNDIWTARYNGYMWIEHKDMDAGTWETMDVGTKLGTGVTIDNVIVAMDSGADPDDVYYWKWDGKHWGQPATDTGENADNYISLEKQSPNFASDMGYLYFDDNGSTDTIYFARITGLRQGRLVVQISANADDAHTAHNSDVATDSGTQVKVVRYSETSSSRYSAGFRFQNINIPQGATIESAIFSAYNEELNNDVYCTIFGHATDNAPNFTTIPYIFTEAQRPRTTASVIWQQDNLAAGWQSKNVTSVVQEIVNRANWINNNALALLLISDINAVMQTINFRPYNESATEAAKLTIDFSYAQDGTWDTPTATTWQVPDSVTSITAKAWGGGGGGGGGASATKTGGAGGGGGFAQSTISVTPGETLNIYVGGGGGLGEANASTSGDGGGGGGYTGVARAGTFLIFAGGGGGGGGGDASNTGGIGGAGGGTTGGTGGAGGTGGGGTGGSDSAPGSGGSGTNSGSAGSGNTGGGGADGRSSSGVDGSGAAGGTNGGGNGGNVITSGYPGAGGGGGGYYGGGGGGETSSGGGGGGGGSCTTTGTGPIITQASGQTAANNSDPDYAAGAGQGGTAGPIAGNGTAGNAGRLVLNYTAPDPVTVTLGDHAAGQIGNSFGGAAAMAGEVLYRFKLTQQQHHHRGHGRQDPVPALFGQRDRARRLRQPGDQRRHQRRRHQPDGGRDRQNHFLQQRRQRPVRHRRRRHQEPHAEGRCRQPGQRGHDHHRPRNRLYRPGRGHRAGQHTADQCGPHAHVAL